MAEKTPKQLAAEKMQQANAMHSAISHFALKLRFVDNETPIEEQLKTLSKYNEVPTAEEVKTSPKVIDSYRQEFIDKLYDEFFEAYPEMLNRLGDKKTDNNKLNFAALGVLSFLFSSSDDEINSQKYKESVSTYYTKVLPTYEKFMLSYIVENHKWNLTKNNQQAFTLYVQICNDHKELVS